MNELFKKRVLRELKNAIESGMLNPPQFLQVINQSLKDLLLMNDESISETIADYWAAQEKLEDEMGERENKIMENANKIYENMIKEL